MHPAACSEVSHRGGLAEGVPGRDGVGTPLQLPPPKQTKLGGGGATTGVDVFVTSTVQLPLLSPYAATSSSTPRYSRPDDTEKVPSLPTANAEPLPILAISDQ